MGLRKTIVLVLRSGGDFGFRDVELIARHINMNWETVPRPRIVCLWDKASAEYDLGNFELIPLGNNLPGTWARMQLYSPEMEYYRPFLYIDLDTAVIRSLEYIFELITDANNFITLEDFYQRGELATGLVWVPANSDKVKMIWDEWSKTGVSGRRMDYFLRKVVKPDQFWQHMTDTIYSFKPRPGIPLMYVPSNATLICFHGKPRIYQAAESSMSVDWVRQYVDKHSGIIYKATVIISYREDRGWLRDAVNSVPKGVQLILSKGDNGFSTDFNRALVQVRSGYVKYLHDDDMLTPNCIDDSIRAIEKQKVDFIHGDVFELMQRTGMVKLWTPTIKLPTLSDLLRRNTIHSASLMYRKEVFDKLGGFKEGLDSSEDYEFNMRCLFRGLKIGYCPTPLAYYRRHPSQKVRVTDSETKTKVREMIRSWYS